MREDNRTRAVPSCRTEGAELAIRLLVIAHRASHADLILQSGFFALPHQNHQEELARRDLCCCLHRLLQVKVREMLLLIKSVERQDLPASVRPDHWEQAGRLACGCGESLRERRTLEGMWLTSEM